MDTITWPVAVAIVGTFVALLTFIHTQMKSRKEKPWAEDLQKLGSTTSTKLRDAEHRITVLEGKVDGIQRDLRLLRDDIKSHRDDTVKSVEKVEDKLEKVTDVTINILQEVSSLKK